MQIRILGTLEVWDDGRVVELGAGRQRALLALLALHSREIVPTDRLIEGLWGGSPPRTAANALQNLVSQLRRTLGADAIVTRSPGYRLQLEGDDLDATHFERLATQGRSALEEDPRSAAQTLRAALDLWRGPALADFAYEDFAQREIARMDELRLGAVEDRIDADLATGAGAELVRELEPLVSSNPLRERLRGQLMLALYRAGRQADALGVYRHGRKTLAEELGLEPDEALQRLEKAILTHDPSLNALTSVAEKPRRAGSEARVLPDAVALVDADAERVVASVPVGRRPVAVTIGFGSIWVANADDGTVSRIDPDRQEVVRTIGIGAPAVDLAVGLDALWVANGSDGTVSRVDPDAEAVVDTIDLRGSSELAWNAAYAVEADADAIWVAVGPHHLARIDPRTSEMTALTDMGSVPVGVASDGRALWVATIAGRAVRVALRTSAPTVQVQIGFPVAIAWGAEAIWVSGRKQVWRIDPGTAAVTQTIRVGHRLMGLRATEDVVWAADNGGGTVIRIDPETGLVASSVTVGHAPTDLVWTEDTIWVSVQGERAM
jgi:DNA-binding SARP family transcriptional activator/DNA-binding beta-propeller fold protein YncE